MKPSISFNTRQDINSLSAPSSFNSPINQPTTTAKASQAQPTSLLNIEFPLFEEATQTASRFLDIPICFVGISTQNTLVLKAAVGLSQLGLMNPLARTRRLSLEDSLIKTVLRKKRSLAVSRMTENAPYVQSCLVRDYGIQSYLGMPLLTSDGACIGLLAAMDTTPHKFSAEAIAFMELLARWSVSEYERCQLARALSSPSALSELKSDDGKNSLLDTVRLTLMSQLTQDMRNPLTTIVGMASMLSREVYGPLTPKQREYADIVRDSSQVLLESANEVLELSALDACIQPLQPTSVDIDVVGQQVRQTLAPVLHSNRQSVQVTVEPGSRLWTLDRDVIRQMLYHLLLSIARLSGEGGTLRVHSSERDTNLHISIRMTHPWLGEGLHNAVVALYRRLDNTEEEAKVLSMLLARVTGRTPDVSPEPDQAKTFKTRREVIESRETLSLLLGRYLIERHDGTLALQGNTESGYRFSIMLPFLGEATPSWT
ncbi:GAF domain-containing sensor histidine kinase [Oscillatoria sp. CS-180]|uniref:GAF domain-containing sensor histidine kinase n=1 Tax=Oscillatoria sp. CS-180 TaxID=3021720 RepID=UPI00233148F4|nr:GAF domain-containing sensor histidine kinase [Oscillatoria sp. CS-180]MDB9527010.1 GAF domain-containing sensor histidine kinase [Oscillatoria sp. CS-180]